MRRLLKITAVTAALIILLNVPALADVRRDETVYTLLNADGSVSNTAVVVRLSGSSSEAVTEYGDVGGWKLLDGAGEPAVDGDSLIWPAASITRSGLYYQIPTDEQAPVAVSVAYRLDGRSMPAGELAGQSGRLTIELTLTNLWEEADGYAPLLCQVTFTLPSDRFSNVEGGGTHIMVGHDLKAVATLLPAPAASVTLTADVTQLELEPVDIQVMPGSVVLPAELEEGIDKLSDGVVKLDDGAGELRDGVAQIREAIGELADGAGELADGIDRFAGGIRTLYNGGAELESGLYDLSAGLDEAASGAAGLAGGTGSLSGGMDALNSAGASLADGLSQAGAGADQLAAGADALAGGLNAADQLGSQIAAQVQALLGSGAYLPDSDEYALFTRILQLTGTVNALSGGASDLRAGASAAADGLDVLEAGFAQYRQGVEDSAAAAAQIAAAAQALAEGLAALDAGLAQSGDGFAEYRSGVQQLLFNSYKIIHGSRDYADGMLTFHEQVAELVDGASELADGIAELNESINEELMKSLGSDKENPVSFADARNADPATQIFLLRTVAVRMPEIEEAAAEPTPATFWQRVLALFKKS